MISDNALNKDGTTVTCEISSLANNLLIDSAGKSKRSKKCESELRLEDHLRRFSSISAIGIIRERPLQKPTGYPGSQPVS